MSFSFGIGLMLGSVTSSSKPLIADSSVQRQLYTLAPSASGSAGNIIFPIEFSNGLSRSSTAPSSSLCQCLVRPSIVASHCFLTGMPLSCALFIASMRPAFCTPVIIVLALRIAALWSPPVTISSLFTTFGMDSPCKTACVITDLTRFLSHATCLPSLISFSTAFP